jgi:RNA polymerase primary sigma factor
MSTKQRIVSETELRAQRLLGKSLRVIYTPDFDKRWKKREIVGDMPNFENFKELRKKVANLRGGENVIAPELRPCYEEPLLSKEQEFHLFRKMNYLKYRAKKLLTDMNPRRVKKSRLDKIEKFLADADLIRNQIANSNFRLATQILRRQTSFCREHSLTEISLSDGYFDVLKAIDYFDFNTGFKFSTYCTWVLKKNFGRDIKTEAKYQERFSTGLEDKFSNIEDGDDGYKAELDYENNKKVVRRLLAMLADDEEQDLDRQAYAIEEWFGLNGKSHRTLKEISYDLDVTKERVRQLKEKGLGYLREKVKELGLSPEDLR